MRVKLQRECFGEAGPFVAEVYSGGDEVLFGASSDCEVRITSGYGGIGVVAGVRLDAEDGCLIRNLTPDPAMVQVDGAPVYSIFRLEDGDLLDVGGDQFRVLIPRFAEPDPVPVVVAPPIDVQKPEVPKSSYALRRISGTPEAASFSPADNFWSMEEVLDVVLAKPGAFIFANFRGAKQRPEQTLEIGDDLLSKAPDEIREMFSLHAIAAGSVEQKKAVFHKLSTKDSAVIVLPEGGDLESCLQSLKLYYGWLTKPSVLDFTLAKGSKPLTTEILKPIQLILMAVPGGAPGWKVVVKATSDDVALRSILCGPEASLK